MIVVNKIRISFMSNLGEKKYNKRNVIMKDPIFHVDESFKCPVDEKTGLNVDTINLNAAPIIRMDACSLLLTIHYQK